MKRFIVCALVTMCASTFDALAAENHGFLTPDTAPDSFKILPPPPLENSIAFLNDKAAFEMGKTLRDMNRQSLAASDANYKNITAAFSDSFGKKISKKNTPVLYELLEGVLEDSHDYAMRGAKNHYMRVRPFVVYNSSTCTPELDHSMSNTGSYPSGHASFGWAAALVLAEINPDRETEILRRGYDFGQSRVVCGAHWQSDVDSGRLMGAAVVAALHNNKEFLHVLEKAKYEFNKN
ncbi:acid phosphatase [Serratia bockelmannii]|uniref:acid phosphatase n=1 Tax=Serratia bockelmannii TaxID=2703793 RepID=UPI0011F1C08D|nr:phosphatase PAP2 family protein [Serratia bockelmannii]